MVCPRRPILEDPEYFNELFKWYRHYKNGYLPCIGGIDVQPHKLMVLFGLIEDIKDEVEARRTAVNKDDDRKKGNPFAEQMKKG